MLINVVLNYTRVGLVKSCDSLGFVILASTIFNFHWLGHLDKISYVMFDQIRITVNMV